MVLYVARISAGEGKRLPVLIAPGGDDDVVAQAVRYAIKKDGSLHEVQSIGWAPFRLQVEPTSYTVRDLRPLAVETDAQLQQMYDNHVDGTAGASTQVYAEYVDGTAAAMLAEVNI